MSQECCSNNDCAEVGVEAIITVDDRGQMVLPKEVRNRIGLKPGEKLALVTWEQDGEVCCMSLIKTGVLSGMVKSFLGPMMREIG